jgi:site-specific recombinase XerC
MITSAIRPFDVAAWVKELDEHSAPSVKQQLAAVRMLFDWLVIGQVVPMNPAAAVRGPKHVVKTGTTPVLDAAEWRKLIDSNLPVLPAFARLHPNDHPLAVIAAGFRGTRPGC